MSGEITLLKGAGLFGVGATAISSLFGPGIVTIVLTDPVILLESLALIYLAFYLFSMVRRNPEQILSGSRTIFPVLTINGVGVLISEPKRSLRQQG